jgi:hypothetical protein
MNPNNGVNKDTVARAGIGDRKINLKLFYVPVSYKKVKFVEICRYFMVINFFVWTKKTEAISAPSLMTPFYSLWQKLNLDGFLNKQFVVFEGKPLGRHLDSSLGDIGIVDGSTLEVRDGVNPNHGIKQRTRRSREPRQANVFQL